MNLITSLRFAPQPASSQAMQEMVVQFNHSVDSYFIGSGLTAKFTIYRSRAQQVRCLYCDTSDSFTN
jgi:hypothetical protein